jgi:hypothetical protein
MSNTLELMKHPYIAQGNASMAIAKHLRKAVQQRGMTGDAFMLAMALAEAHEEVAKKMLANVAAINAEGRT